MRALALLSALVATPQRALFAAGIVFGLASPRLARFVATRALSAALRGLNGASPARASSDREVIVEHLLVSKLVVRTRRGPAD